MVQTGSITPASVRKFQFDDFDGELGSGNDVLGTGVAGPDPTFSHEELVAARAEAAMEGHALGLAEAKAGQEAQIEAMLGALLEQAHGMVRTQEEEHARRGAEAIRLACQIARRVLPVFAATSVMGEIEAMLAAVMKERAEEPRLVIRLPDALFDPVAARLDRLIAEAGFASKPILLADPALRGAEVRMEWANGGADWSFEAQLGDIEANARQLAGRPPYRGEAASLAPRIPRDARTQTDMQGE